MTDVVIIGGGAAGMMAAVIAASNNKNVVLIEKNEKLGKKLFITGKGRCNFTNAGTEEDVLDSIISNKKFMYSAFHKFSNYDCMGFFDELGLKFKVERGERVFPESDHSSDVIGVLARRIKKLGVDVRLNTRVTSLIVDDNTFKGVEVEGTDGKHIIEATSCIVATGGNSYQTTGSTGDGYEFARRTGHSVTEILPALVPINIREEWTSWLMGLSLKNVEASFYDGDKKMYSAFGEMLFTHFGVSGPIILSASSVISKTIRKKPLKLVIDLKPALTHEQLDNRILRDFGSEQNKSFKNSLDGLLPNKLKPVIVELSGISQDKKVNAITKQERLKLVSLLKSLSMTADSTRGFNEAIITQGGVDVKQINPQTMESKLVKGLYFAGEVLDVDALTGGFNLQIAWSTAYAAGQAVR